MTNADGTVQKKGWFRRFLGSENPIRLKSRLNRRLPLWIWIQLLTVPL